MIARVLTMTIVLLGAATGPPVAESAERAPSIAERIAAAEQALARNDYGAALDAFRQAREVRPDAPELSYNMGVAAYKAGRLDEAADLFRDTLALTDDPALRSKTAYNLGTTAYARALRDQNPAAPAMPPAPGGDDGQETQVVDATKVLAEALDHYRDALEDDPANTDARFNAELTQRLLTRLEEMAQEQQQQQQMPGEQTEDQENTSDDQRAQQQEQEAGEQQRQEQQEQEQQEASEQEQPRPAEAERAEEQGGEEDEQQPEEAETEGEDEQPAPAEEDPAADEPPEADEQDGRGLSRAEAERLLQRVRDRERQRREELAEREAGKHPPVDKDW